jgi:hypothetical protein
MEDFLSEEWFATVSNTLAVAGPVEMPEGVSTYSVVFSIEDAPPGLPHAFTITMKPAGGSISPIDAFDADTIIRLNFADASGLYSGSFDSGTALREGRIKVRGHVNNLIPLMKWFQAAYAGQSPD